LVGVDIIDESLARNWTDSIASLQSNGRRLPVFCDALPPPASFWMAPCGAGPFFPNGVPDFVNTMAAQIAHVKTQIPIFHPTKVS
jgi:hypothetical protein